MPFVGGRRSGRQLSLIASRGVPATRWGSALQFVQRLPSRFTTQGGYAVVPGVVLDSSPNTNVSPECTTGTGAAYNASVSTKANAGLASGTGAASWGASYSSTILADSPIAYWRLGEPSGTTADNAQGDAALDGTYTGTNYTLGTTGLLTGDSDTALGFTGTGGYVVVPYAASLNVTSNFSFECWLHTPDSNTTYALYCNDQTSGDSWIVWVQAGTLRLDSTTGSREAAGGTLAVSTTYHIVVTRGSGANSSKVYVNNVDATSYPGSGVGTFASSVESRRIGAEGSSSTLGAGGVVDEVAVYGSVLTPTKVATHYTAGTTGGGTGGATAKISGNAGVAAGAGAAYDPPFPVFTYANAVTATGTGVAYDPPIRYAPAGLASGVGAANAPPASLSPNAGAAAGTGAAYQPAAGVSPNAGVATGTGIALVAAASVAPNAATATGTGVAQQPTTTCLTNAAAATATATGAAQDVPIKYVLADQPTGTGAAQTAAPKVDASAGLAAGTGAALDATVTTGGANTYAAAELASGTGAAQQPTTTCVSNAVAVTATGTGDAYAPVASVSPNAGAAAGTGAAYQPVAGVSALAGVGAATGTANVPSVALGPSAGLAAGTGAAADTGKTVKPSAGAATGTGAAFDPTVSTSSGGTYADAGVASGSGAALDATVTASPSVFAWADTATGTGTAYGAAIPTISGVTRDEHGTAIPLCTVDAFVSATNAFYATTTSNGTGHYSIVVAPGVAYFLVAYSALDVYGVTARDLTA